MKKPNITEPPWVWMNKNTLVQNKGRRNVVLMGKNLQQRKEDKLLHSLDATSPDAKAISAVPEMVDALIEAHEIISHEIKFEKNSNMRKMLVYKKKVIVEALRKAGATEL